MWPLTATLKCHVERSTPKTLALQKFLFYSLNYINN